MNLAVCRGGTTGYAKNMFVSDISHLVCGLSSQHSMQFNQSDIDWIQYVSLYICIYIYIYVYIYIYIYTYIHTYTYTYTYMYIYIYIYIHICIHMHTDTLARAPRRPLSL